jgi:hypothetical protein
MLVFELDDDHPLTKAGLRRVHLVETATQTDELRETLAGALGGLAEHRLEFGESLLDWVEVWGVAADRRAEPLRRDRLGNAGRLVTGQIVEHPNVMWPQGWRQHLLDISAEALAIYASSKTQGAVIPLARRPATRVVTFQRPCGTGAKTRNPRPARP